MQRPSPLHRYNGTDRNEIDVDVNVGVGTLLVLGSVSQAQCMVTDSKSTKSFFSPSPNTSADNADRYSSFTAQPSAPSNTECPIIALRYFGTRNRTR